MSEILNNQVEVLAGVAVDLPAPNVPIKDYDEVVIKHISYAGLADNDTVFLLWCTYTNSYVASFTIDATEFKADQSYETVIRLNKSSSVFGFKVFYMDNTGILAATDVAFIAITLQFNKYKK